MKAQVPLGAPVRALLQAWQVPVQAVSQQNPSTHWPDWQVRDSAQAAPSGNLATQALPEQTKPAAQSRSLPQEERHPCAGLQT